ncbi:MAG: LpqB family beta-propeller domain-containing protein [Propionibacteriaceae bacterium]|jgi:hypothetical protein|nr:LpqB family beta-propeller domain-containing protein [Propionibacteriaceae bacterium]
MRSQVTDNQVKPVTRVGKAAESPVRAIAALLAITLFAGCATLPTTGSVETYPREPVIWAAADDAIEIDADPPPQGAAPALIVQGFLLAMSSVQTGYATARQYLTEEAAATWDPRSHVLIYADGANPRVGDDGAVTISATTVGQLGRDGAYSSAAEPAWNHDFGLVRDASGEWRISHPPDGLALPHSLFMAAFTRIDAYFYDSLGEVLLPDSRYVSRGQGLNAAVDATLTGPSSWLAPLAGERVGPFTRTGEVTVSGAVATIPIDASATALSTAEITALAAECGATLRQTADVDRVRFIVDGEPIITGLVADGSLPVRDADAVNRDGHIAQDQLFILRSEVVARARASGGEPSPVDGDLGQIPRPSSALAVSADALRAAVLTPAGIETGLIESGPTALALAQEGLTRPQFDLQGRIWTMANEEGGTSLIVIDESSGAPFVTKAIVSGLPGTVQDFRLAPDGRRIAVIATVDDRTELGLIQVQLSATGEIAAAGNWRGLRILWEGSQLSRITDLAWTRANSLALLASAGATGTTEVFHSDIDGLGIEEWGRPDQNAVTRIATVSEPEGTHLAVLDEGGQVWSYQDIYQWSRLADGCAAIAYPG